MELATETRNTTFPDTTYVIFASLQIQSSDTNILYMNAYTQSTMNFTLCKTSLTLSQKAQDL